MGNGISSIDMGMGAMVSNNGDLGIGNMNMDFGGMDFSGMDFSNMDFSKLNLNQTTDLPTPAPTIPPYSQIIYNSGYSSITYPNPFIPAELSPISDECKNNPGTNSCACLNQLNTSINTLNNYQNILQYNKLCSELTTKYNNDLNDWKSLSGKYAVTSGNTPLTTGSMPKEYYDMFNSLLTQKINSNKCYWSSDFVYDLNDHCQTDVALSNKDRTHGGWVYDSDSAYGICVPSKNVLNTPYTREIYCKRTVNQAKYDFQNVNNTIYNKYKPISPCTQVSDAEINLNLQCCSIDLSNIKADALNISNVKNSCIQNITNSKPSSSPSPTTTTTVSPSPTTASPSPTTTTTVSPSPTTVSPSSTTETSIMSPLIIILCVWVGIFALIFLVIFFVRKNKKSKSNNNLKLKKE